MSLSTQTQSAGASAAPAAPRKPGQLLTADQLAQRWQVPKSQVYRLARDGRVPVVAIGRYYRFREAAIEAFERAGEDGSDD